jgi:hypothetical protein
MPTRAAEQRARLVAAAARTYGKQMFQGFLETFQDLLRRWILQNSVTCDTGLIIRATGRAERGNDSEATHKRFTEDRLYRIKDRDRYCFEAQLWRVVPGEGQIADIDLKVRRNSLGPIMHLDVLVSRAAGKAAMGLLSAVCTGIIAGLYRPFTTTTIRLTGMWGPAGKREAEDLVGPLRLLAESFTYYQCVSLVPAAFDALKVKGYHPLGHVRLFWHSPQP